MWKDSVAIIVSVGGPEIYTRTSMIEKSMTGLTRV